MHNNQIITNQNLFESYVTAEMEQYFYKKMSTEEQDYIRLKVSELLKFLTLSHHTYGDIPFNSEIDDVWHLWILQTIQYSELMAKLPGKKFINHCSNDYPMDESKNILSDEDELNRQVSFLVSYVANFGNFTRETVSFWPATMILMELCGFDVDQLNIYLYELSLKNGNNLLLDSKLSA